MKFITMTIFFFLFTSQIEAKSVSEKYERTNYDEAKKSTPYLKFTGTSTKFGLVSTEFDGYAKNFEIQYVYDEKLQSLQSITLSIQTLSLDTDNSSRNEKLHTKCLAENETKKVTAQSTTAIKLSPGENLETVVKMTANNKEILIPLKYHVVKTAEGFEVKIIGDFSFKDAGINDPSIAIAKLEEKIKIEGVIQLK